MSDRNTKDYKTWITKSTGQQNLKVIHGEEAGDHYFYNSVDPKTGKPGQQGVAYSGFPRSRDKQKDK